ncbi:beta strand repeat-containing protein [Caenispirillum bisanense]|uniref:Hemolysin-type calcium-binding repeat-containing protein n=1 Tax=Caenispirillum bisanense TaxID=414052 RepID=A0A286GT53_9PROT|nr:hypothetical protein [Caenispirillum bisanense]SOD98747.1 hypothetical protein SAMN05421508_10871 [Caenispirillum bisanense]
MAFAFDEQYYLQQNPDVLAAVLNGSMPSARFHFDNFGWRELRDPNAVFDTSDYVTLYTDVLNAKINPFNHFLSNGAKEGRAPSSEYKSVADNFDATAYLAANNDVKLAVDAGQMTAWQHFVLNGQYESRPGAVLKDGTPVSNAVTLPGSSTGQTGSTFTLTANADNLNGTSGNDTFGGINNATTTQFSAVDSISGGAGTDTLSLELNASYAGGAKITGIEVMSVTSTVTDGVGTAGGTFNLTGISGLTTIRNNGSANNATGGNDVQQFTNVASAANVEVLNTDGDTRVVYADAAVAGAADAVTLTLNNVAQANAAAVSLNTTSTTTGATGIETLNVVLAGAAGTAANSVTLNTNAAASLSKVVVSGSSAGNLTMGTNITTTATTIDASAASGAITLAGIGAAAHTITLGSGNDSVDMGGNLTSADTVKGGTGTDTIASTAANWNTLNTAGAVLTSVTEFETLRVTDDAASGVNATIDASLVGAVNLRLAAQAQAGGETVTVNNLGGSTGTASVRLDGSVAGVTLNVKDATLPGTANVVNLDVRGTSATSTFTMNGVETVNVDASNATTAHTLAMTDGALTTLKIVNTGAATFNTGTLGANVSSVDASGVTGAGAVTITLNGTANSGATVTGSAGADTITGSNQLDVINAGAGNDVIIQSLGNDRINVGTGTDDFRMGDLGDKNTAITITGGTTIDTVAEGFDIVTGMSAGDTIRMAANYTGVGAAAANTAVTAVAFNTTFADNGANLVRGTYNSSNGQFVISATGADSLFVADVDDTGGTSDFSGVVLVGYATAATAANLVDQGAFVDFTLIA